MLKWESSNSDTKRKAKSSPNSVASNDALRAICTASLVVVPKLKSDLPNNCCSFFIPLQRMEHGLGATTDLPEVLCGKFQSSEKISDLIHHPGTSRAQCCQAKTKVKKPLQFSVPKEATCFLEMGWPRRLGTNTFTNNLTYGFSTFTPTFGKMTILSLTPSAPQRTQEEMTFFLDGVRWWRVLAAL
jgi:hypothetical protein